MRARLHHRAFKFRVRGVAYDDLFTCINYRGTKPQCTDSLIVSIGQIFVEKLSFEHLGSCKRGFRAAVNTCTRT